MLGAEQPGENPPFVEGADEEVEMPAAEAGKRLGIGHSKLAQLLKAGDEGREDGLPSRRSPLDQRVRLVKARDVERLLRQSAGMTLEQARMQLGVSHQKMQRLIKEGTLPVHPNPLHPSRPIVDPERFEVLLAERHRLSKHS